jgi:outer membrane protein assembly factor BamB
MLGNYSMRHHKAETMASALLILCVCVGCFVPYVFAAEILSREIAEIPYCSSLQPSYPPPSVSSTLSNSWPMFRHNANHTGFTDSDAPRHLRHTWTFSSEQDFKSSPAIVNNKVYVGSDDFKIYCVDLYTGEKLWEYKTGSDVFSSPAVINGKLYIGSNDKNLYCLNADTGDLIWTYTSYDDIRSSPTIYNGRVYVGGRDGRVYCIDADDGREIWRFSTGGAIYSSPAVADDRVYVGSWDTMIYCLDAEQGYLHWSYATGDVILSSPAVEAGKLYVGSNDQKVYCLDAIRGNLVWTYTTWGDIHSSPAVTQGYVYIGSRDGNVYCLKADTGVEIWRFSTGGAIYSSPAVADGLVYVGSWDTKVYCIDMYDGSEQWKYKTNDAVYSSPAIAQGKVIIGSWDSNLYCFEDPNTPPQADFTYSPQSPHSFDIITFTDTSQDTDGTIVHWDWDFGDGTASTDRHPQHYYTDDGNYTVTLTVTDNYGDTAFRGKILRVFNLPPLAVNDAADARLDTAVDIDVTANDQDSDGTIQEATVTIISDSQHGTTAVSSSGIVTYTPTASYVGSDTFSYTVKDDDGATSNVAIVTITIIELIPPTAAFSFSPSSPSTQDTIQFTDESTDDEGIASWNWDFGDSIGTSTQQHPTYIYDDDGDYIVHLTVTDTTGLTSDVQKALTITNVPPVANDDSESMARDTSLEINVTANDYDIDGTLDRTSVAITANVAHGTTSIHPTSGIIIYTPQQGYVGTDQFSYTIKDDDGAVSAKATVSIDVLSIEPPHADFTYSLLSPFVGELIQFHDTSTDNSKIIAWQWSFGDGTGTSTDQHPIYHFKNIGSFKVRLTITDDDGQKDSVEKFINVERKDTPPIIVLITEPSNNSILTGTISIEGWAISDQPLKNIDIRIDTGPWLAANGLETWMYTWDTSSVQNGPHVLYVQGSTTNGYTARDFIEITVENPSSPTNIQPTITLLSPTNGQHLSNKIKITGTAVDDDGDVQLVEIKIDAGPWKTAIGTTTWMYTWDTTEVSNGDHIIYTRSYDGSDYSHTEMVLITVDNVYQQEQQGTKEDEGGFSPLMLFIILLFIILLLAAVPLMYIFKM